MTHSPTHRLPSVALVLGLVLGSIFGPARAPVVAAELVSGAEVDFGRIESIEFFDRLVVTGSAAGLELHVVPEEGAPVRSVQISAPAFDLAAVDAERLAFPSRRGKAVAVTPARVLQGELNEGFFTPLAEAGVLALAADGEGGFFEALGNGAIRHTDAAGTSRVVARRRQRPSALAAEPGGRLAAGDTRGRIVVGAAAGETTTLEAGAAVRDLRWSPGATGRLGVLLADGTVGWFEGDRFETLPTSATAFDWSADGEQVAVGRDDGSLEIWATQGGLVDVRAAHDGAVTALRWGPRWLGTADVGGRVRLFESGSPGRGDAIELTARTGATTASATDGERVAVAHRDGAIRLWDGESPDAVIVAEERSPIRALALHAEHLAWATEGGDLIFARLAGDESAYAGTSRERARVRLDIGLDAGVGDEIDTEVHALTFIDGGRGLLAGLGDGRLLRLDLPGLGILEERIVGDRPLVALEAHDDQMAIGDDTGALGVTSWTTDSGAPEPGATEPDAAVDRRRHQSAPARSLAWSSDGARLASGHHGGAYVWPAALSVGAVPTVETACESERAWSTRVAFVDADRLACGGDGVGLWSLDRGAWEARLSAEEIGGAVRGLAVLGDHLVTITDAGMRSWRIVP